MNQSYKLPLTEEEIESIKNYTGIAHVKLIV